MSVFSKLNVCLAGIAIVAIVVLSPSTAVLAQDVASGQATATVQTALTVTCPTNLAFATVYQGVAVTCAEDGSNTPTGGSPGVFSIVGQAGAGISLYMSLPDYMATSSGDDRMVISFGPNDCGIDTSALNAPNLTPRVVVDPGEGFADRDPHNLPATVSIGSGGGANDTTAIYLGGKITPTADQKAGAYTADIILTVAYNGN